MDVQDKYSSYYGILIHKRLFFKIIILIIGIFVINHFIIRVVIFQLTKVLYTHLLKKSIPKIKKIKK